MSKEGRPKIIEKSEPIVIPLTLYCQHGDDFVQMFIRYLDRDVPCYEAECPKCKKTIVFDFDGGLLCPVRQN